MEPELKSSHRIGANSFSRNRKLNFPTLIGLILQKSVKSLQIKLNEYFAYLEFETASASAFTQARANLSHGVFIELNKAAYGQAYYEESDFETYKGHRLLAVDGSKVRLPDTAEITKEFGQIRIKNQYGQDSYTGGLCSVLYDVLNEIVIDGVLAPSSSSEVALAIEHTHGCQEDDLILFDRNYAGYALFAILIAKNINFLCRCSTNAFRVVEDFIADATLQDTVVTLTPCKDLKAKVSRGELPPQLQIRLVKILLSTGEIEILATSLIDQQKYPLPDFKELYAMRWNIETLYNRFKNRLALENFTGYTLEAVRQDFYATILISNVESEITADADKALGKKQSKNKYPQKVNKNISYNAIKTHVFELLQCSDIDNERLIKKLHALFIKNPIPIRLGRSSPRDSSTRRSLNFHKRSKKCVF